MSETERQKHAQRQKEREKSKKRVNEMYYSQGMRTRQKEMGS